MEEYKYLVSHLPLESAVTRCCPTTRLLAGHSIDYNYLNLSTYSSFCSKVTQAFKEGNPGSFTSRRFAELGKVATRRSACSATLDPPPPPARTTTSSSSRNNNCFFCIHLISSHNNQIANTDSSIPHQHTAIATKPLATLVQNRVTSSPNNEINNIEPPSTYSQCPTDPAPQLLRASCAAQAKSTILRESCGRLRAGSFK